MRSGPKLEEIFLSASRSFLYLSGTYLKAINLSFLTPKFSEKIDKFNDYLHLSVVSYMFHMFLAVSCTLAFEWPVESEDGQAALRNAEEKPRWSKRKPTPWSLSTPG